MVQIVDLGPKRASFQESLLGGLEEGLDVYSKYQEGKIQKKQQDEQRTKSAAALKQLTGMDLGDLPADLQKTFLQEHLKGQASEKGFGQDMEKIREKYRLESEGKAADLQGKENDKMAPFQSGLEALNRMKLLRQKGNLGFGSSVKGLFSPDTRKDRGEYAQLGKSLISLASTIPIRNQREFETMAESLYDPSVTDAEAEGILNAMERIITNSMGGEGIGARGPSSQGPQSPQGKPKERPPLSSFHR
jgi:hypothetical protein